MRWGDEGGCGVIDACGLRVWCLVGDGRGDLASFGLVVFGVRVGMGNGYTGW